MYKKNILENMLNSVTSKKYSGFTPKTFSEFAKKNEKSINETVFEGGAEEGVSKKECKSSLKHLYEGTLHRASRYEIFLLADSLGCDDLGLRASNEDLGFIYATLWTYWGTLTKYEQQQGLIE